MTNIFQKILKKVNRYSGNLSQKNNLYRLFLIQINLSQLILMSQNETYEFLEKLAKKSDSDFFDQIKNGNIEIKR